MIFYFGDRLTTHLLSSSQSLGLERTRVCFLKFWSWSCNKSLGLDLGLGSLSLGLCLDVKILVLVLKEFKTKTNSVLFDQQAKKLIIHILTFWKNTPVLYIAINIWFFVFLCVSSHWIWIHWIQVLIKVLILVLVLDSKSWSCDSRSWSCSWSWGLRSWSWSWSWKKSLDNKPASCQQHSHCSPCRAHGGTWWVYCEARQHWAPHIHVGMKCSALKH